MSIDLTVVVTAYERQAMLDANINGLTGNIIVMDDHSLPKLKTPHELIYASENHGKERYWQWINVAFERLRATRGDVLITADDIAIKPGGIEHAQMLLDSVRGYGPVAINLLWDRRVACWNKIKRTKYNSKLYSAGFVDGCFIMNRHLLELMEYRIAPIDPVRWKHNPLWGSGVWQYFTNQALLNRAHIFQDSTKVFTHGSHLSKMNPIIRKRQPL